MIINARRVLLDKIHDNTKFVRTQTIKYTNVSAVKWFCYSKYVDSGAMRENDKVDWKWIWTCVTVLFVCLYRIELGLIYPCMYILWMANMPVFAIRLSYHSPSLVTNAWHTIICWDTEIIGLFCGLIDNINRVLSNRFGWSQKHHSLFCPESI